MVLHLLTLRTMGTDKLSSRSERNLIGGPYATALLHSENASILETEYTAASMLDDISETKIEPFLRGIIENMDSLNWEALKDFLWNVIGQVTLDPTTHECQINYHIGINLGDKVASPRGFEPLSPP